eukprot:933856-Rhodomonas_salina.3
MFVKHMTIELHQQHPENKQAENMRKIGELWRQVHLQTFHAFDEHLLLIQSAPLSLRRVSSAHPVLRRPRADWSGADERRGEGQVAC